MPRWRLILDGPLPGAWNMAVDEALVEAVDRGDSPPVLRLYRWSPPCLSLGFAQPAHAADREFCARHGVDLVRRPTGGRAVLHHLELTYSVTARLAGSGLTSDLQAAYQHICEALVAALRRLGIPAELSGPGVGPLLKPTQAVPCFVGPATGEVVAQGRKLVGSAMRRVGDAILQHGAILEGWAGKLQAGCLGLDDDAPLRQAVATISDFKSPARGEVEEAVVAGFSEVFGVDFETEPLGPGERGRAKVLEEARYSSPRWTLDRQSGVPGS